MREREKREAEVSLIMPVIIKIWRTNKATIMVIKMYKK